MLINRQKAEVSALVVPALTLELYVIPREACRDAPGKEGAFRLCLGYCLCQCMTPNLKLVILQRTIKVLASWVGAAWRAGRIKQCGTSSWPSWQSQQQPVSLREMEDPLFFGELHVGGASSKGLSLLQMFGPCRWRAASLLTNRGCSLSQGNAGCQEEFLLRFPSGGLG